MENPYKPGLYENKKGQRRRLLGDRTGDILYDAVKPRRRTHARLVEEVKRLGSLVGVEVGPHTHTCWQGTWLEWVSGGTFIEEN